MMDTFGITIASTLAAIAVYVWTAASLHAVFRKAGQEGWQAWVPVLNTVVLLRLGGFSGWWALLLLVPIAGTIALAVVVWIACSRINASFGVGVGMTVLAVLAFPVWSSILGWGSARWLGREQARPPRPVRTGNTDELEVRLFASTYSGPEASSLPPRPPLPSVAPYAAASQPEIVTHMPSAAPPSAGRDESPGYVPRRRSTAEFEQVPVVPTELGDEGADETSGAPYTGTLPVVGAAKPAGPRRALRQEPSDVSDEHSETHDAPVAHAPTPASGSTPVDPWAPPLDHLPPVRMPRYSPGPAEGGFSDTSAEVSAVAGAPSLGEPMAARSSVSALRDEPELPDAESAFDETIIGSRRRTAWMLTPPLGAPIAVTSDVLIVGRRPSSDPQYSHAQLVPVADETRTMSKTHARLQLDGDGWLITDLDSTNGVVLVRADGREIEIAPGRPEIATETFLLGDAELRLTRARGAV